MKNRMTVLAIQEKHRHGFYVALIPGDLDARQIDVALGELAVKPSIVCEIEEWQEAANGVRIGFMPLPQAN